MTRPVIEGSQRTESSGTSDDTTTRVAARPAGTTEGDLVVIIAACTRGATTDNITINNSYTALHAKISVGTDDSTVLRCFAKVMTASESHPTLTVTSASYWCIDVFRISGATTTIADIAVGTNTNNTPGLDGDLPSVSINDSKYADSIALRMASCSENAWSSIPVTPPTSHTTRHEGDFANRGSAGSCWVNADNPSLAAATWEDTWDGGAAAGQGECDVSLVVPPAAAADPAYTQTSFRFRNDDGVLSEPA
ncbi:MAG: hypothetical protein QNJ94_18730 [Alphaproteobacteria bacterium]|nr:hypothetical protein [Alphaproteobacteria bacterium]